MRKINEIFYSLQGEGYHTGTPAVFIRFSGCNLKCPFCDTQHEDGILMSDEDIVTEVSRYPAATVILTGGEPSLWIDREFVDCLHQAGKYVCIETNGTHPLPDNIDWVTCSPKQGVKLEITLNFCRNQRNNGFSALKTPKNLTKRVYRGIIKRMSEINPQARGSAPAAASKIHFVRGEKPKGVDGGAHS